MPTVYDSSWVFARLALPLVTAICLLTLRWGKENIVYAVSVPFVLVCLHLYFSSQEWPKVPASLQSRGYRVSVWLWHLVDCLALLALGALEFIAAVVAEIAGFPQGLAILAVLGVCFLPYAALTLAARLLLRRAYRLAFLRIEEITVTSVADESGPAAERTATLYRTNRHALLSARSHFTSL